MREQHKPNTSMQAAGEPVVSTYHRLSSDYPRMKASCMRMFILLPFYSLADVGYCVHPAANANLVANIWGVAELVHDSDVVGIRSLEQLLLQCNCVNLQEQKSVDVEGGCK